MPSFAKARTFAAISAANNRFFLCAARSSPGRSAQVHGWEHAQTRSFAIKPTVMRRIRREKGVGDRSVRARAKLGLASEFAYRIRKS